MRADQTTQTENPGTMRADQTTQTLQPRSDKTNQTTQTDKEIFSADKNVQTLLKNVESSYD